MIATMSSSDTEASSRWRLRACRTRSSASTSLTSFGSGRIRLIQWLTLACV